MTKNKKIIISEIVIPGYKHKGHIPLDSAYLKEDISRDAPFLEIEINPLHFYHEIRKEFQKEEDVLQKEAEKIKFKKPILFVLFLENIFSSGCFFLGIALKLAQLIKKIDPQIKILFYSYKIDQEFANFVLKENKSVDFLVTGSPVEAIKGIISKKSETDYSLNYADNSSPYLNGSLDNYLNNEYEAIIRGVWGCPGSCYFCSRGSKFSKIKIIPAELFVQEIAYIDRKKVKTIFIMDDRFIINNKRIRDICRIYKSYFPSTIGPSLKIATRPESLTMENISLLKEINVSFVQMGIQSFNPDTYHFFGRYQELLNTDFPNHFNLLKKAGIETHLDLILGLPLDNFLGFKRTVDLMVKLSPRFIKINQLFLSPGTRFYNLKDEYGFKTQREDVNFKSSIVTESASFSREDMKKSVDYLRIIKDQNRHINFVIAVDKELART